MSPSRRSPDRFAAAAPSPGPIWRQALAGLGLNLGRGPAPAAPSRREQQLEQELEEAIHLGRWIDDEERALLAEHAAAEQASLQRQARLRTQRRAVLVLAGLAILVPVLWPLVIIGVIAVFPRTSRRLLLAGLALAAALVLAVVLLIGQLLHRPAPPPTAPPLSPSAPAATPQPQPSAPPGASTGSSQASAPSDSGPAGTAARR